MAKLVVHNRAARYIERMDARTKTQLIAKLEQLAKNPAIMPGVKPMAGEWAGFYRLRHGDLRVIYLYDQGKRGDFLLRSPGRHSFSMLRLIMQRRQIEVRTVRPDQRLNLEIDANLIEHDRIVQRAA